MPDKSEKILPFISTHHLPGLDLGSDVISPNYEGYSLLNLPASICRLLGIPDFGGLPLKDELLNSTNHHFQRIVLFVLDGLGLYWFQSFLQNNPASVWNKWMPQASLVPLTTVSPSTTSAALTTLWTGASPAAHGIVGYELWLKEFGVVANMITHSVMTFSGDTGGLRRAGFQPESFLSVPTLGPHLSSHGIQPYAFLHQSISRSGLSAMHLHQVNTYPFQNVGDMLVGLRNLLNDHTGESLYTFVYWGDLDELSHRFGPDNERVGIEFDAFSQIFAKHFLDRLTQAARKDTLLLVTADHGQVSTPKYKKYELSRHPALLQSLHILPTGENRLAYLHLRPGKEEFVRRYIEETWPGQFTLLPTAQVLSSGLLGPGKNHPRLEERLGDLVAIAHGDAYWWWAEKENPLLGRHGGLSPSEMLIPLYALPL